MLVSLSTSTDQIFDVLLFFEQRFDIVYCCSCSIDIANVQIFSSGFRIIGDEYGHFPFSRSVLCQVDEAATVLYADWSNGNLHQ